MCIKIAKNNSEITWIHSYLMHAYKLIYSNKFQLKKKNINFTECTNFESDFKKS